MSEVPLSRRCGSEADSNARLIDFGITQTLGLRVIEQKKKTICQPIFTSGVAVHLYRCMSLHANHTAGCGGILIGHFCKKSVRIYEQILVPKDGLP